MKPTLQRCYLSPSDSINSLSWRVVHAKGSRSLLAFSETGDTCLGSALSKFNPNNSSFANIPPYFDIDDPVQDEHLSQVMNQVRRLILTQ